MIAPSIYSLSLTYGLLLISLALMNDSVANADNDKQQQQQDILRRFSTKFVLTFDGAQLSKSIGDENDERLKDVHRLEIEELYDQEKSLAKIIIVNGARAERAELHYRGEDLLYLETLYDLDVVEAPEAATRTRPSPRQCTASIGTQPSDGFYFNLVQKLTEGANRSKSRVLLGPSVFIHAAQADLLARYSERSAEIEQRTRNANIADLEKKANYSSAQLKHRFILEQGAGLVRVLDNEGRGPASSVEFSQADYMLDRSPLLTQLAAHVSYSNKDDSSVRYSIDYLEIDNVTMEHLAETNRDLFRLPLVRACLKEERTTVGQFGFDSTWSRFFQLRSSRFSMNVHAENLANPLGIHVAADMERHLMRFDVDTHSRNVIDLQHEFIYHMPNEPAAGGGQTQADLEADLASLGGGGGGKSKKTNKVRNSHCSLISSESFPGLRALTRAEIALTSNPDSASRWVHLIGRPGSVIYLGSSRRGDSGQRAHEFELSYLSGEHLSPFLVILFGQDDWQRARQVAEAAGRNLLLVGRFFIKAGELSCSPALNSHRPLGCINPTPLSVQLDLVRADDTLLEVVASRQVQFTEFEWELLEEYDDVGKLDRIYETFDRRLCPVEKLELQLDVEWKEEIVEENFKPGEEICHQHRGQLEDLVFGLVNEYLQTYASFDVELMDLKLKQALPGTQVAQYTIILTELPDLANTFKRIVWQVSRDILDGDKSKLLAKSDKFKVLFECLTWSAQFGNSLGVLHSPKSGCFVYDKIVIDNGQAMAEQNGRAAAADDLTFTVYERSVESFSKSLRNSVSGLRMFESEHIDSINHEIIRSNRDDNAYEACLTRASTGQSLVRDIKLGKLRQRALMNSMHNDHRQQVPIKSGFRFAEIATDQQITDQHQQEKFLLKSRRQFEVVSQSECERRCSELVECESFSYCKNIESRHQFCQLSELKLSSKISPTSLNLGATVVGGVGGGGNDSNFRRQSDCQLHSKDYLRYFESAQRDAAAELAGGSNVKLNQWTRLAEGEASEFECASLCQQKGPGCMRFIHCQPHACYYRQPPNDHQTDDEQQPSLRLLDLIECSLFKRKSLGLYARTMSIDLGPFNWRLDSTTSGSLRAEVLPGAVSEEKCAQLCTENVECQSFDSCSTAVYTKTEAAAASAANKTGIKDTGAISLRRNLPHFVCTLLSHSLTGGLLLAPNNKPQASSQDGATDNAAGRDNVELSKHCRHFERKGLEPASKLLVEMLAAQISTTDSTRTNKQPSADSKAASLFSAAILGLTLGIAANMLLSFVLSKQQSTSGAANTR